MQEELNRPELRGEAAGAIRSLIEEIRLVPQNDRLEIELSGDLAGILAIAAGKKKPVSEGDGPPVTLVAGTRSHLYRTWMRRKHQTCVEARVAALAEGPVPG